MFVIAQFMYIIDLHILMLTWSSIESGTPDVYHVP